MRGQGKRGKREYGGIPIGHNKEDITFLQTWAMLYQPELIVELGTMYGGMTTALHEAAPEAFIATFDMDPSSPHPDFIKLYCREDVDIYYKRLDLLKGGANHEVLKFVAKPVRKMLYCDNGEKLEELLLYAPSLQTGDLLGVHDWGVEIHTRRKRVKEKFRRHYIMYRHLRIMLKQQFDLVSGSAMCRLWIKR